MSLDKTLKTYTDIKNRSGELKSSFIKQILLMSSSLLGILISFHKMGKLSTMANISFDLTLSLISFGIILLSIALFEEVSIHNKLAEDFWEETKKQISNNSYDPQLVLKYPQKIYKICQNVGYITLVISIISLTFYGIFI